MDPVRQSRIKNKLDAYINDGSLLGGGVSGIGGDDSYLYTAGFADIEKTTPFNVDTITRCASDSKVMGTVAFLKLIDRGDVGVSEDISTWIPGFADTKVIEPHTPECKKSLTDAFTVEAGSSILSIRQPQHWFSTGDRVAIQGATEIGGVPAAVINQIHVVTVVNKSRYTVKLATEATSTVRNKGGKVTVSFIEEGVKITSFNDVVYYYKELPLARPIKIDHVLTHTLGYMYSPIALGAPAGYVDGRDDPSRVTKTMIQAGIFQSLGFPVVWPILYSPLVYPNIRAWTEILATVPLLFQPGESWSYGPTLSILGALIESIDGRPLETYFKEEITEPLGMNDTGFFIQNDDPDREEKLARIQTLTVTALPHVFIDANTIIPGLGDYFYGADQPKSLPFIDGGLYSTIRDRDRFYTMLLNNGEAILSPAMVSLMSHNRILDIIPQATFPPIKNSKWGFGVAVGAGADDFYPLMGQTKHSIFWGGFFGTQFIIDWTNRSILDFVINTFSPTDLGVRMATLHYASLNSIEVNNEDVTSNGSQSVKMYE